MNTPDITSPNPATAGDCGASQSHNCACASAPSVITPGGVDAPPAPTAVEQFHEARRKAGLLIDPATAEVTSYVQELGDPYEIRPYDSLDQERCIGRVYFARSPGSVWVWFGDLPDATREHLQKHGGATPDFDPFDDQESAR
jgi:hypothetical protein